MLDLCPLQAKEIGVKILIIVGAVVGLLALAFGALVLWGYLEQRRKVVHRPIALGEQRELPGYEGATVAWFWFHFETEDGRLVGVAQYHDEHRRLPVAAFPLVLDRFLVRHHGGRTISIQQAPCEDADFFTRPGFCVPLLSEGGSSLRIAAPTRVGFQAGLDAIADRPRRTPVPDVPLVGAYMIPSAAFGDRDVEQRDVVFHIRNTATGETVDATLEKIRRDTQHVVLGVREIIHRTPAPDPPLGREPKLPQGAMGGRSTGGDFVLDLGLYVSRPASPVAYEVWAECGPHRSETVRVVVEP
jgi:hypothetical protein